MLPFSPKYCIPFPGYSILGLFSILRSFLLFTLDFVCLFVCSFQWSHRKVAKDYRDSLIFLSWDSFSMLFSGKVCPPFFREKNPGCLIMAVLPCFLPDPHGDFSWILTRETLWGYFSLITLIMHVLFYLLLNCQFQHYFISNMNIYSITLLGWI